MIDFSTQQDKDEIFDLWKTCFGDEDKYIDFFINNRFVPEKTLVKRLNGVIVSMLFLLDGEVKISGEIFSSYYIYAACTHPAYRKQGHMEDLINDAKDVATENSVDYISLVPATKELFGYYKKFGFLEAFKRKQIIISRRQLRLMSSENADNLSPDIADIYRLRNRVLSSYDSFLWGEKALDYALKENYLTNGKAVFAGRDGNFCGYALFHDFNGRVEITELCALNGAFGDIAYNLLKASESDIFKFSLPVVSPLSCDASAIIYNAMLFSVSDNAMNNVKNINNAYLGLTLG